MRHNNLSVTSNLNRPMRDGALEPPSSGAITLPELIGVVRRRFGIIVFALIVFVAIGIMYCLFKTRRYQAATDLAINPEGSNALDLGDVTSAIGGGGLGFDEKLGTQVRILKSDILAWQVISERRLDREEAFAGGWRKFIVVGPRSVPKAAQNVKDTDPVTRDLLVANFHDALNVTVIPRTQAIQITFRSSDPALARDVVNQLATDYTRQTFMMRYEATMAASHWLSGQLDEIRARMEQAQEKLAEFQQKNGIFGNDEDNNLVLSRLDDLNKEATDAEADRILKEAKYRIARSGNPELIGTVVPDTLLPTLRQQEAALKVQLAQANATYGSDYPKVVQLHAQLTELEKSIQNQIGDVQERFRQDYEASHGAEKQFQDALAAEMRRAGNLASGLDEYGVLKRQAESVANLYEDLQKKLLEAGSLASLRAVTVDVINPATLPTRPVEPNIPLAMAVSLFLGVGLGAVLGFVAESLDNAVRGTDEIERVTQVPIFGISPHRDAPFRKLTDGKENGREAIRKELLAVVLRPTSRVAEAFNALRTSLLLAVPGEPPKMVMIVSALPAEGKTTVSTNLALSLASRNCRVLLVDADLRRGQIARRFDIPAGIGLSGALAGTGKWQDAVHEVAEIPNLSVLQTGSPPPNPGKLLGTPQMIELMREWRTSYDHVIIDCAPALLITDALLIAQHSDATLLVVRAGTTTRVALKRVMSLFESMRANITGIVINDVSKAHDSYGYGYGNGYKSYSNYYADERD